MEKIILKANSKEEVEKSIKTTIKLDADEVIEITEKKKPFSFLFFKLQGVYEINILKKSEQEALKRIEKEVELKEEKLKKQEIKKQEIKKENVQKKKKEKTPVKEPVKQETKKIEKEDENIVKIRKIFKEFLALSSLNVKIKKIEKIRERYIINIDGKDVRYVIGEKGIALNSLEYLLISAQELKGLKINIDSNDYKQKREESLKNLATKKAEKVIETGKNIKLNPMTARERKIIHKELSKFKEIETESYGEEPKRCLIIKLKK